MGRNRRGVRDGTGPVGGGVGRRKARGERCPYGKVMRRSRARA